MLIRLTVNMINTTHISLGRGIIKASSPGKRHGILATYETNMQVLKQARKEFPSIF